MKFKCMKCGNCCSDENILITVTHKDLQRLVKHLKCALNDLIKFIGFYYGEDLSREKMVTPAFLTVRGSAFLALIKKENGECIFLKNNRCSIYPARPLVCRSFPFVFSVEKGWLKWGLATKSGECIGVGLGEEISTKDLEKLGLLVINELEEFKKLARRWNTQVYLEDITPTPLNLIRFLLDSKNIKFEKAYT